MQLGVRLSYNVRAGTAMMLLGNLLAVMMGMHGGRWKDFVYLIPANLGLGLTNPSILFSFVSFFEHKGMNVKLWSRRVTKSLTQGRSSGGYVNRVSNQVHEQYLWYYRDRCDCPERTGRTATRGFGGGW